MKPEDTLTPLELILAQKLIDGVRRRDLAKHCGVSETTIKHHITSILQKIGADDSLGIAVWFMRRYPTEESAKAGFLKACVHVATRRKSAILAGLGK